MCAFIGKAMVQGMNLHHANQMQLPVLWSHTPSASGSYGRQAETLIDLTIFKILYQSHY